MHTILHNIARQLTYDPHNPLIFSSGLFLALFVGFTLAYYLLRNRLTPRIIFVTLFSYYFYYKTSGMCLLLLAGITTTDYLLARALGRGGSPGRRRALLALSLAVDLGLLGYFKYANFFGASVAAIVGHNFQPSDIFLPVGISFFTFQSMSYTIDVYRGQLKPLDRWLDYAFYVSFFPQLVAGPIVRARDFAPQIHRPLVITRRMIAAGVYFIIIGLVKKSVISDYISLNFVDRIFDNPLRYTGLENLCGLLGYSLQIYCDFSGYSDMAIGIALLLGFHFPANFNAPYKSESISDFWRRWHISLSTWIRDYVYISLGGNRKGKLRTCINLIATMLLAGLWHGAGWNFVLWGGLHGVALAGHKWMRTSLMHHDKHYRSRGWRRAGAIVLTFTLVTLLWIPFRNHDIEASQHMLSQMAFNFHPEVLASMVAGYKWVFLLIVLGFLGHYFPLKWQDRLIARLSKCGVITHAVLLAAVIFLVCQVKSSDIQPFIYFQF